MQSTLRNLDVRRVADGEQAEAIAWLARRLAWEQRLRDLDAHRRTAIGSPQKLQAGRMLGCMPFARAS